MVFTARRRLRSGTARAVERAIAFALAAVTSIGHTGCREMGTDPDEPFETASFKYVYAVPAASGEGYILTRPDDTACPGVPAEISLTVLVDMVQKRRDYFNSIVNCGGTFLVAGAEVAEVRENGLFFDYRVTGGQNDAVIRLNRLEVPDSTAVDPTGMVITTTGGLTVGQPTTIGYAEISFIQPVKVFTCADGGPDWVDNTNVSNATFFEIELTDQSSDNVEGAFQCVARNETDPSDERLLLIVDGAFSMVPR